MMVESGFRRLHKLPKRYLRWGTLKGNTAREKYYYQQSRERFEKRPDAFIFDPSVFTGEIGHYEDVRFITTDCK